MKRICTLWMYLALSLHSQLYAQEQLVPINQQRADKPFLFSSLPNQFECDHTALQKILSGEINDQINIQLSPQFGLRGKIVDKNIHESGYFSINIVLNNYKNALFNLSVRLLADNSFDIQARILHPGYGDVLILYKDKDRYYFKKQLQRLYMPE